jgi:hypothetical protein
MRRALLFAGLAVLVASGAAEANPSAAGNPPEIDATPPLIEAPTGALCRPAAAEGLAAGPQCRIDPLRIAEQACGSSGLTCPAGYRCCVNSAGQYYCTPSDSPC